MVAYAVMRPLAPQPLVSGPCRGAGRGLPGASPFPEVAGEAHHGGGSRGFLAAAADGSGRGGVSSPSLLFSTRN